MLFSVPGAEHKAEVLFRLPGRFTSLGRHAEIVADGRSDAQLPALGS
jgi:hypothetical protein